MQDIPLLREFPQRLADFLEGHLAVHNPRNAIHAGILMIFARIVSQQIKAPQIIEPCYHSLGKFGFCLSQTLVGQRNHFIPVAIAPVGQVLTQAG